MLPFNKLVLKVLKIQGESHEIIQKEVKSDDI